MDAERARIEAARRRNLELDEQRAAREADALLASMAGEFAAATGDGEAAAGAKPKRSGGASVYVTGLATYMACRQLEAMCGKIGKVRRVKFYKDDHGGLKGDAVVTFHSHAAMLRSIERLDGFELKPGVVITASAADFSQKQSVAGTPAETQSVGQEDPSGSSVPAGSTPAQEQNGSQLRDAPSRSLVLEHVWDPLAPQDDASFFDDLEEDMRSECAKHGPVEHIHIVADGSVLVRFAEPSSAIACQKVMNGRWFDGRQVVARFDDVPVREPDAADSKLEAFLTDIGG